MTNEAAWFEAQPACAVADLRALCEQGREDLDAAASELERAGGPPGSAAQIVAELGLGHPRSATASATAAAAWHAYEQRLDQLGMAYSRAGVPLSAWYGVASRVALSLTTRAVATHAAEPVRLTAVLTALSGFAERSLAVIAGAYYVAKQQREGEVRARHRRLIDGVLDPVIEIDEHDLVVEINHAAERAFGYGKAEALGRSLASLIIPERFRDPHRHGVARFLATGEATILGKRVELVARRADGSELPVELSLVATDRLDGGRGFIGFLRDLTEDRRTAASLARSAARLELLSNTAHEFATAPGDIQGLLALVARRLSEIIGEACAVRLISDDGAWLAPSTSFFHRDPDRRELVRQVLATEPQRLGEGLAGRVAATGEPILVPVVDPVQLLAMMPPAFRPALAKLAISSALAIPLRSHGRVIGAVSVLRSTPGDPYTPDDLHLAQDLADRAGLAIDNAMLVHTLEHRVAQRTAALEAVNQELEAFSYSVSHDLRTPLRGIDGFSRALQVDYAGKLDERAQHYLQRIRGGAQRMAELIDDLLNLARITRVPLKLAVQDLSAIAAEVVGELQRREPGRSVAIHIAPELSARADARLFRIALENLFDNAWKFTARHEPAQIWFGSEAGAFYVRDTGAGFDMAYAPKLFVPFERLHAVNEYEGTGVGLATVHRIITYHGGRIWAEAEVGKGATFFFTLGPAERAG